MSAATLERALWTLGIDCVVEAHEGLALIVPRDGGRSVELRDVREDALRLLGEHGFTHLALELVDGGSATLPRD